MTNKSNKKSDKSTEPDSPLQQSEHLSTSITILHSGQALKLAPGSTSKISYDIGRNEETHQLCIRLNGSDSGGLCSKAWIALTEVMALLDQQSADKPFSSALFKSIWQHKGSSNNAGFLAAVLRDQSVIISAPDVRFAHLVNGTHHDWLMQLGEITP
jgi:hypothetical protein